jgi:hypothetical protein
VFEPRWNRKPAASDRLQGVPHYDNARKPAPLPPPVATLIQIIGYDKTRYPEGSGPTFTGFPNAGEEVDRFHSVSRYE